MVWQDRRSGTDNDIYGTGVSAGGVVQQPAGVAISTAAGDQDAPDVAVRYDFLVVWRDRRSGTGYDVYGTRISPAGVVEDPPGSWSPPRRPMRVPRSRRRRGCELAGRVRPLLARRVVRSPTGVRAQRRAEVGNDRAPLRCWLREPSAASGSIDTLFDSPTNVGLHLSGRAGEI